VSDDSYTPPKFCPQCGTPVTREGARFCTSCGRDFTKRVSDADVGAGIGANPNEGTVPPSEVPKQPSQPVQPAQQQPQPYGAGYRQQSDKQPRSYDMITPNDIRPATGKYFSRAEYRMIGFFALMAFISHIMRYFIFYNSFPNLLNLLVPIPLYLVVSIVIVGSQKYFMREKGVNTNISANRFDYTRSLVFSSFFLSLVPFKQKIDKENTLIPDRLQTPKAGEYGVSYQDTSRAEYIGESVKPRMHLLSNFVIQIVTLVVLFFYFSTNNADLQTVYRLLAMYLASYTVVELAPVFGRNNEVAGDYGRFRTLGLFVLAFAFLGATLLGQRFFTALQSNA